MVNIPANLQRVWEDVSKDGKIDKADVQKLIKEAAPSFDINGKEAIQEDNPEIDTQEKTFLSNFVSMPENTSVGVKNGTAKGTFDFIDPNQVKFPFKSKSQNNETPTNKYYKPVELGAKTPETSPTPPPEQEVQNEETQTTPDSTKSEETKTPTTSSTDVTPPAAGPDPKDVSDLKKMKEQLADLKKIEKDPQLQEGTANLDQQIANLTKQITALEEKIAKGATTPANTNPAPVEIPKDDSDVSRDLQKLKTYTDGKKELPSLKLAPDKFAEQDKLFDKKISDIKTKISTEFIEAAKNLGKTEEGKPKISDVDFKKAQLIIERDYNNLPEEIKNNPEVKAAFEASKTASNLTPKEKLFSDINAVISVTVAEALKTGDMSKFTVAKNEIDRLVSLKPELANDPEILKIKAILSGAAPTGDNNNFVTKAINTIKTTEGLLGKSDWSRADYAKAQELVADTDFTPGEFKSKLEARVTGYDNTKKAQKEEDKQKALSGIEDALGKGFLNATNKASLFAIMQAKASKGELEELLIKLEPDDQIKAMRLLAQSNDKDNFNLAIARKLYDKVSANSNVDKKLGKEIVDKIKKFVPETITETGKEPRPKDLKDYQVDDKSFVQGFKYSLYSEKDTALTMTRSIIDGSVSSSVLSQLSREDIAALSNLVGKKGHKGEKDDLLEVIAGNYAKGDSVDVSYMSKTDKINIVKNLLNNKDIAETTLDDLVKKVGSDVIFELVNKNQLTDKQLVLLAKHCDGDTMANEPKVAEKMMMAMIRSYNNDQQSVSINDINKFIDQMDKDWTKDDDIMKQVLINLTKDSDAEYAKFQSLSPDTLQKIRRIAGS